MAQLSITRLGNAVRQGDVLYKAETDYVAEGESGEDKVWTLGSISRNSKDFSQEIVSNGDTIAILEKDVIRHFLMHGDTLLYKGSQQRRSYCFYHQERPVVVYPFHYGDSISGSYAGTGYDENIEITTQGWGFSMADATGMLTDGIDTLTNVMRLHMFDEYTESYGGEVEILTRCYRYLWYCVGYRYPVMESIRKVTVESNGMEIPEDSVTYMYLPAQQSYLTEDAVNDSIQERMTIPARFDKANNPFASLKATYHANISRLTIDYTLSENKMLTIQVCDIVGNNIGYFHGYKETGDWQTEIVLSRRPIGDVLLLNIQCGEDFMSLKVYND